MSSTNFKFNSEGTIEFLPKHEAHTLMIHQECERQASIDAVKDHTNGYDKYVHCIFAFNSKE